MHEPFYFISVSDMFLGTSLPPTHSWSRFDLYVYFYPYCVSYQNILKTESKCFFYRSWDLASNLQGSPWQIYKRVYLKASQKSLVEENTVLTENLETEQGGERR